MSPIPTSIPRAALAAALASLLVLSVAGTAAGLPVDVDLSGLSEGGLVAVNLTGPAEGRLLAVSGTGNATSTGYAATDACADANATGAYGPCMNLLSGATLTDACKQAIPSFATLCDAFIPPTFGGTGTPTGVAASGGGNATGQDAAVALVGDASCDVSACAAASGLGDATAGTGCANHGPVSICDLGVAVAGVGNATASDTAVSGFGDARGSLWAISLTGDAYACTDYSDCLAVSGTGHAYGWDTYSGCDDAGVCVDGSSLLP